ncbi:MAG: hypothetical protein WEB63_05680 [Cucumibacter sp.]
MKSRFPSIVRSTLLPALAGAGWLALGAPAAADSVYEVWCGDRHTPPVTMLSANGFPGGALETFTFVGECFLAEWQVPGAGAGVEELRSYAEITHDDDVHIPNPGEYLKALTPVFFVKGEAGWRRADQTAFERLTFSGPVTGTSEVRWTGCYTNPFMLSGRRCKAVQSQIDIQLSLNAPADVIQRHYNRIVASIGDYHPLFYRRFDIYTAEALSKVGEPSCPIQPAVMECIRQLGAPSLAPRLSEPAPDGGAVVNAVPTPPARPVVIAPAPNQTSTGIVAPPPPTAPLRMLSQPFIAIEAEALLDAGVLQVRGGEAIVQDMSGFGPQWSGNQQVLWTGGLRGASMTLPLNVSEPGTYLVELDLTQAPDFGDLAFEVDGAPASGAFSGFASEVVRASVSIGTFSMQPGTHWLRLIITGKSPQSSNYLAGLDRVVLTALH